MKICVWDIETAKMKIEMETYSRKLYSPYLSSDTIKQPVTVVCASWKMLGNKTVHSACVLDDAKRFKKNHRDDYIVIKALHDLMHDVDVIVAHNGDNFDWKVFTARCIANNLPPPPRPQMVDTLKVARSCFKFDANDLRYLAQYLGVDEKGNAPDWGKVSAGDIVEIKRCLKYNRQDVTALEQIYLKLRPYMKNHPNVNVFHDLPHEVCPTCASPELLKRGIRVSRSGRYQTYQCKECGSWCSGTKSGKRATVK